MMHRLFIWLFGNQHKEEGTFDILNNDNNSLIS